MKEQARLLLALDDDNAPAVVRILDPFITPERRARIHAVVGSRLDGVTVLMDAPHDPHNGAAVLRSCEAFGVQRLHVVERREDFLAARSVTRGAERWVEVTTYATAAPAVAGLRASGYELIATHPGGELTPRDLTSMPRVALVLGNEREGIHDELRAACKHAVRIPMRGFIESLNVSVTAAILLEHATFGRAGDMSPGAQARLYARALALTIPHAPEILAAKGISLDPAAAPPAAGPPG